MAASMAAWSAATMVLAKVDHLADVMVAAKDGSLAARSVESSMIAMAADWVAQKAASKAAGSVAH